MNNEDWINTFINKFNEDKDYKITDVRDREKLLDELRPKGEWTFCEGVTTQGYLECSKCKWANFRKEYFNYCPNCGAKMKGEEE